MLANLFAALPWDKKKTKIRKFRKFREEIQMERKFAVRISESLGIPHEFVLPSGNSGKCCSIRYCKFSKTQTMQRIFPCEWKVPSVSIVWVLQWKKENITETLQRAMSYVTVCAPWKVQSKIFKVVVCNPCQSSPSLTILVSLWFIIISLVFFMLVNYYFQVSCNLKVISYVAKTTQNNVTELFEVKYDSCETVCLPRSVVTLISVIGLTPARRCSANTLSRIQYLMISWNGSSSDGFLKYGSYARKSNICFVIRL